MSDYSYFGGIDLAKNHFSIHVVDPTGKVILHKSVTRSKLLTTIANIPPMRIGLEACGGAHYWARTLNKLGHQEEMPNRHALGSSCYCLTCFTVLRTKSNRLEAKQCELVPVVTTKWLASE